MVVLGQRWAEEYMKKNPKTTIQVTGGGSGTGISALINGTTDICEASRAMKDAEKKQVAEKAGAPPVETAGREGRPLRLRQRLEPADRADHGAAQGDLHRQGRRRGKRSAARTRKIIPYSRENSSGTYVFFKEHVLENADYTPRAQNMPGTAAVVNAVAKEKFGDRLRRRRVREGDQGPQDQEGRTAAGVAPSDATIKDGSYPLSRPLFFYTRTKPSADIKAFTDWVLSKDGQAIVTKVGYFPIK